MRSWLLEGWLEFEILVHDVIRFGPNPLRESPKALTALGILEKHEWLVRLEVGTLGRGSAQAEGWRIVKGPCLVV